MPMLFEGKKLSIIQMRECRRKHHLSENDEIKCFLRSTLPFKRPLTVQKLLSNTRSGEMFGYVHCDIRVPTNLKEKFEAFPPIFKNTLVRRSDISEFKNKYAQDNKLLTQPRRMLITGFQLINGTIITPLLTSYLDVALKYTASFSILP